MSRIVIILLVLNVVSCFVVRRIRGGRMIVERPNIIPISKNGTRMQILLAGMMNQPWQAYKRLSSVAEKSLASDITVFAKFSNFGWSSNRAAKQLDELIYQTHVDKVEVYTISVGDKVVRQMMSRAIDKIYAIDPCPSPWVLNDDLQKKLPHLARLLEATTFLLGWIAILPLIPTDANRYSIALLADQLWEISVNDNVMPTRAYKTRLVLSRNDEFLNGQKISRFFSNADSSEEFNELLAKRTATVPAEHARTSDRFYSRYYDAVLRKFETKEKDQVQQFVEKIMAE